MSEKKTESVTFVHVEKQGDSPAKATVNKDGKKKSGEGASAEEALSNASKTSKNSA